jgi:hypothetical protein
MTQTDLYGFGLRIASAVPVPGALPVQRDDPAAMIGIALATSQPDDGPTGFWADAGIIAYRHAGATFRCSHDTISVTAPPGADPAAVGRLLIANALPALLWLREAFMLHAATVVPPGREQAVAVIGASGSGKSRVALAALHGGAELIGDDSLAISIRDGTVTGAGLPGGCCWNRR